MAATQKHVGKQKSKVKFDPDYFEWPHPIGMITVTVLIYILIAATIAPESIPTFFGPLRSLAVYMGTYHHNICVGLCAFTLVAHTTEAAFAGKVCHDRGMSFQATCKWIFSTFLFGFTSLVLKLLPYKPEEKSS